MSQATILIVEDESIVAADVASKLKRLGYAVAGMAARGEDAVALAGRLRPSLVLMDIWLEGPMDGVAAAEAIRRERDVPVVYLTAHSDSATLTRAKLTGPFGYILKPFDERELATQIELALYKHQTDQQLRQQHEWLHVTLTSIADAVLATDATGHIAFINPVAQTLTGWTAEEAVGQPIQRVLRLFNEQTGEPLEELTTRVLRDGRAVALANHSALQTKDGRAVPIEDSAAPIRDAAGQVIGAVFVFHDVTEKRRAEEALRQAKDEWEETFNTVPDCVAILDRQHRIIRVNQAMARRLNKTAEQCVGLPCYDVVHGTMSPHAMCPHVETCGDAQEHAIELEEPRLGGSFLVTTSPRFDTDGTLAGTVHVARDITRLKRTEKAIQQLNDDLERRVAEQTTELCKSYDTVKAERQRLYDLLETLPVFVVLLSGDYHISFANRYFREQFGEFHGCCRYDDMFPHPKPCEQCELHEASPSGAPRRREWTLPDGRVYDIHSFPFTDADGSKLVLEMGIDMTDRRRAEAALQANERSLIEAQRIAHLGNWEWNIVTDQLTWSDEVYRIFGLSRLQFGRTQAAYLQWVHPADLARVRQAVHVALAEPRNQYRVEHRVVRPDGTHHIVDQRGEVTFDPTGTPVRMIGTVHDITEQRRAEEETLHMKAELAHVERTARMGELAASLAHEINQPLTAILCNAQAARRFVAMPQPDLDMLREILDDIIRDDKRAGSVIHRLRAMLQKGQPELESFPINEVIGEVVQLLRSEILERNVSLSMDLASRLPVVEAGRVEVQQVLVNLLLNALDALQDQPPERRKIVIRTHLDEQAVAVAICDRGCGIRSPDVNSIFEPFFTTKSTGLGMGLAICRRIIQAHGGRIWAVNSEEGGATVSFSLPCKQTVGEALP